MEYEKEQTEILYHSDKIDLYCKTLGGKGWAKYKGDAIARVIIRLINVHLPQEYKMVGPDVFIKDHSSEIDAALVRREAKTIRDTNAYLENDVLLILEIKKYGIYCKRSEAAAFLKKYFDVFRSIGKPFLYLTVRENSTQLQFTKAEFSDTFCLARQYKHPAIAGEWERFIHRLKTIARI